MPIKTILSSKYKYFKIATLKYLYFDDRNVLNRHNRRALPIRSLFCIHIFASQQLREDTKEDRTGIIIVSA